MKRRNLVLGLLITSTLAWLAAHSGPRTSHAGGDGIRPLSSPIEPGVAAPAPDAMLDRPLARHSLDARGPQASVPPESLEPQSADIMHDPCSDLRLECTRLAEEVRSLRHQLVMSLANEGLTAYEHFLRSSDADLVPDPDERKLLKDHMSLECPFYLQPGEVLGVIRIIKGETAGAGSWWEQLIRFLGPARVLREASPEWITRARYFVDDAEWEMIFGMPPPP
ncbi:MAG: hypothetical protein ACI8QZ_003805 [Chlamydiales bacterium]|jgi:hypothetical protein